MVAITYWQNSPLFDPYEGNDIFMELTVFDIAFHFVLACRINF